jgi:hypothetical protein
MEIQLLRGRCGSDEKRLTHRGVIEDSLKKEIFPLSSPPT